MRILKTYNKETKALMKKILTHTLLFEYNKTQHKLDISLMTKGS